MEKETMGVLQQVTCMKGGVGEESYALNSKSQVGSSLSLFSSLSKLFFLLRIVWLFCGEV